LSYLRLTPEEFRAIWQKCDSVKLSGDFFAVFRYFLIESLSDTLPDLAIRIRRFRRFELILLYRFLRSQRMLAAKSRERTPRAKDEYGLTAEQLQAVRRASGPFFLYDGCPGSFQDFLAYNLRETRPGLAAKLARLGSRQVARLYQLLKQRSQWNA
jgi:hypothetical protein